jgi:acyl CoA:acetate/3-ketoacid CoA transferase alpha subunit
MRKVVKLAEAVGRMPDGVVLMIGGFMGASTPLWLVQRSGLATFGVRYRAVLHKHIY